MPVDVIGLFLPREGGLYHEAQAEAARRAAAVRDVELRVYYAEGAATQQAHDIARFLGETRDRRRCVLVVPVVDVQARPGAEDGESPLIRLARRVLRTGSGWVVLNRDMGPARRALKRAFPGLAVAQLGFDQVAAGRLQGQQARALCPRGGGLLYLLGNRGASSACQREQGLRDELEGAGFDIRAIDCHWTAEQAERGVIDYLRSTRSAGPLPSVVVCQNDDMAAGARRALTRLAADRPALAGLPVTGFDGAPGGQEMVKRGLLTATVQAPITAGEAVELVASDWATGAGVPDRNLPLKPLPAISSLAFRWPSARAS